MENMKKMLCGRIEWKKLTYSCVGLKKKRKNMEEKQSF